MIQKILDKRILIITTTFKHSSDSQTRPAEYALYLYDKLTPKIVCKEQLLDF